MLFLELWPFSCEGFVGTMDIVLCIPESVEKLLFDFGSSLHVGIKVGRVWQ